jgi:glutamyl-Q tRNA(Asp) synthetase
LGVCTPRYLHTPLVWAADGQKLSKQTGAQAVDVEHPLVALQAAADVLGLAVAPEAPQTEGVTRWLERATQAWGQRWA